MSFDVNSYITRWIAFGGAALAALVATFVSNEAQMLFGLNLNGTVLLGYLTPFLIGTFGLAWKWLDGRASQEYAVLISDLETDLHLNPALVEEIKKLIEEKLPSPPVTK